MWSARQRILSLPCRPLSKHHNRCERSEHPDLVRTVAGCFASIVVFAVGLQNRECTTGSVSTLFCRPQANTTIDASIASILPGVHQGWMLTGFASVVVFAYDLQNREYTSVNVSMLSTLSLSLQTTSKHHNRCEHSEHPAGGVHRGWILAALASVVVFAYGLQSRVMVQHQYTWYTLCFVDQ